MFLCAKATLSDAEMASLRVIIQFLRASAPHFLSGENLSSIREESWARRLYDALFDHRAKASSWSRESSRVAWESAAILQRISHFMASASRIVLVKVIIQVGSSVDVAVEGFWLIQAFDSRPLTKLYQPICACRR